jgi:hypothetical protein
MTFLALGKNDNHETTRKLKIRIIIIIIQQEDQEEKSHRTMEIDCFEMIFDFDIYCAHASSSRNSSD